jgi:hypothetical protein
VPVVSVSRRISLPVPFYLFKYSLKNLMIKRINGAAWKNKSKISMGLFSVPFFSIISFSKTWGMGLNGRRSMMIANMIRIEYGILSRILPIIFPVYQCRMKIKKWIRIV